MNQQAIQDALQQLLQTGGVRACALVDSTSGLVWHAAGCVSDNDATLWEASIDYWRMYGRLRQHFDAALGELGAAVMYHRRGVLALLPCSNDGLVVVCVADHRGVDWTSWQRHVRALGGQLGL
jgi:hypothetical protein